MKAAPAALLFLVVIAPGRVAAAEPVALRTESLMLAPAHGPLLMVDVKNLRDVSYQGVVSVKVPEGWQIAPPRREVTLAPREMRRVPFTVEKGLNLEANGYAIEVTATGADGTKVVRRQVVAAATAPYFKPTIDGNTDEWKNAFPVTFTSGGKKTTISTYWSRRRLSILVAVEEDKLTAYRRPGPFDAVQVAVSPQGARTGTSPDEDAARFEFLLVSTGNAAGKCFQLAQPGMRLSQAAESRDLGPLEYEDAELAVSRRGETTFYECAIPFRPMRERIRPSEGREFCLSVLVHDPDGTGLRDWGRAAGLWPWQRNALAWSRWAGAKWGEKPPFDNKTQWGLCSSKY